MAEHATIGGGLLHTVRLVGDEQVRISSWTTFSKGWVTGITGKLFLTDQRLIFCPIRFPLPFVRPVAWSFKEIERLGAVKASDLAWLWHRATPGLSIWITTDGERHFFVLNRKRRNEWLEELAQRAGLHLDEN